MFSERGPKNGVAGLALGSMESQKATRSPGSPLGELHLPTSRHREPRGVSACFSARDMGPAVVIVIDDRSISGLASGFQEPSPCGSRRLGSVRFQRFLSGSFQRWSAVGQRLGRASTPLSSRARTVAFTKIRVRLPPVAGRNDSHLFLTLAVAHWAPTAGDSIRCGSWDPPRSSLPREEGAAPARQKPGEPTQHLDVSTQRAKTTPTHPGLASAPTQFQAPSASSMAFLDCPTATQRQPHLGKQPTDQPLAAHRHTPLRAHDHPSRPGRPGLPETDICNPLFKDESLNFAWLLEPG